MISKEMFKRIDYYAEQLRESITKFAKEQMSEEQIIDEVSCILYQCSCDAAYDIMGRITTALKTALCVDDEDFCGGEI